MLQTLHPGVGGSILGFGGFFGGALGLGFLAILIRMAILGGSYFHFSMCRVSQLLCMLSSPCDWWIGEIRGDFPG